jgi:hypothetical protein
MNNVVQYVSYGCGGKNSSSGFDSISNAGNDNNTNDEDDDNEYDDEEEERDLFWLREFDYHKLILCTTKALAMNYNNYIYKKTIMVFYNMRMWWLNKILNGNWICCVNMFRMDTITFQSLCFILEIQYGLKPS